MYIFHKLILVTLILQIYTSSITSIYTSFYEKRKFNVYFMLEFLHNQTMGKSNHYSMFKEVIEKNI